MSLVLTPCQQLDQRRVAKNLSESKSKDRRTVRTIPKFIWPQEFGFGPTSHIVSLLLFHRICKMDSSILEF